MRKHDRFARKLDKARETALQQLVEVGVAPVQTGKRLSGIPYYSSVAGKDKKFSLLNNTDQRGQIALSFHFK